MVTAETVNNVTVYGVEEIGARILKICLQRAQVFWVAKAEQNPQYNHSQKYFGFAHDISQEVF